ncbi:hypothetical protein DFJ73DRAFT_792970 [Zopfochytrium polystomum]|nr:hypothetical protein DFJ73DRAFT_792970 [Zopfochytrium polystomum]
MAASSTLPKGGPVSEETVKGVDEDVFVAVVVVVAQLQLSPNWAVRVEEVVVDEDDDDDDELRAEEEEVEPPVEIEEGRLLLLLPVVDEDDDDDDDDDKATTRLNGHLQQDNQRTFAPAAPAANHYHYYCNNSNTVMQQQQQQPHYTMPTSMSNPLAGSAHNASYSAAASGTPATAADAAPAAADNRNWGAQSIDPAAPALFSSTMRLNWSIVQFAALAVIGSWYTVTLGESISAPVPSSYNSLKDGFFAYSAANILGLIALPLVYDGLGRRYGIPIGAGFIALGTLVQLFGTINLDTYEPFLVGLAIVQIGTVITINGAALYVIEVAHPAWRAFFSALLAGFPNLAFMIYRIVTFVASGLSSVPWRWKLPLVAQLVVPVMLLCWAPFVPETPRWLIRNGDGGGSSSSRNGKWRPSAEDRTADDRAHRFFFQWQANYDEENDMIERQVEQLRHYVLAEPKLTPLGSFNPLPLFRTGNLCRRMLVLILLTAVWNLIGSFSIAGQYTYYAPSIAGLSASTEDFISTSILIVFGVIGAGIASQWPERFGRRPLLIMGFGISLVLSVGVAGSYHLLFQAEAGTAPAGTSAASAAAALFTFQTLLRVTRWMLLQPSARVLVDETMPFHLRARAAAAAQLAVYCAQVATDIAFHYLAPRLGAFVHYYTVAGAGALLVTVVVLVPETKGRTLEQVGEAFDNEEPWKEEQRQAPSTAK